MKYSKKLDLRNDSVYNLFFKIAIPSSIGTNFQTLYSMVDSIYAGKLISPLALAAIGQTFPIYFIIIALGVGLSIGSTSLISNYLGSDEDAQASQYFSQSILLSIIVALVVSFFGVKFSVHIIYYLNSNLETLKLSTDYLNIIFIGSIFIFILMSINSALSAQGDTKSYRNVLIFSFFLNIFLNPIMITGSIFDMHIFDGLGIKGLAYSTIISQFVGIFYLLIKFSHSRIFIHINLKNFIPRIDLLKKIMSQGIPASVGMLMISLGSFIILFFVASFGDMAIAGFSAALRYEQLFLLPLLGLSTAVISMVGQNYGAKNYLRIYEIYIKAIKIGCIILFIFSFIIFLSAEYAMSFFTNNEEVIIFGSKFLKIASLQLPAFPLFFIGNATFQGLKKAIIVMYLAILRFVLMPFILLYIIIFQFNSSYDSIFITLFFISWIIGISYFYFTRNKIKKIINTHIKTN